MDFWKASVFGQVYPKLQTMSICLYFFLFFHFFTIMSTFCMAIMLVTPLFFIPLMYSIFYFYDQGSSETGGYSWMFMRKLFIWKVMKDYFPIRLVKTVDLDPSKNYLFCVHPHGIVCFGTILGFATDACDFSKLFPGLKPHCLTLNVNFYAPISREFLLAHGTCLASLKCIKYILTNQGKCKEKGQTCILAVGGAEEALSIHPYTYVLTIKKRKGFIRSALVTGASLVPVFSFGENETFSTIVTEKGSLLRYIQGVLKRLTSIGFAIWWGQGLFGFKYGIIPHRVPINVVVGKPIHVVRVAEPTNEQIDALQSHYIDELTRLFEDNKNKYFQNKPVKFVIE